MVKRLLFSTAIASLSLASVAQTFFPLPNDEKDSDGYYLNGGLLSLGISPNGRYVCGSSASMQGFVYDTESGKMALVNPIDDEGCEYRQVSDNGIAVGFNGPSTKYDFAAGEESVVWANCDTLSTLAEAVTNDGEYIIGEIVNYAMTQDNAWQTLGVVWHNGQMTVLPCPTSEEMGFAVSGTKARYISADGSVIAGSVIDDMSTYPVIAWRRQADGSYKLDPICKGRFCDDRQTGKGPFFAMIPGGLSPNGRYISLGVDEYTGEEKMNDGSTMPASSTRMARYDMQTGELTTFPLIDGDGSELPCEASGVSDDGTMLGYATPQRFSYAGVICPATTGKPELLTEAFPEIEAFQIYDMTGMNRAVAITADGKKFTGFGIGEYGYQAYIVTLDENATGVESVKTVPLTQKSYYTLDGRQVAQPRHGLFVETDGQGHSRKVMK